MLGCKNKVLYGEEWWGKLKMFTGVDDSKRTPNVTSVTSAMIAWANYNAMRGQQRFVSTDNGMDNKYWQKVVRACMCNSGVCTLRSTKVGSRLVIIVLK